MPLGEYLPDPTEGVIRTEDLPQPRLRSRSRNFRHRRCPRCGRSAYRYDWGQRTLHDLGNLLSGRPHDLVVTYSKHRCDACPVRFCADLSDLADPGSHYTRRVVSLAVRLVVEDGLAYRAASWHLWRDHRVFVPFATVQNWVEAAGGEAAQRGEADHLDWALEGFSGYLAIDELYDGPFCVLSAVDSPRQRRVLHEILAHSPDHGDLRRFLTRLGRHIESRGGVVRAITTDGSPLYPQPLAEVFPGIPHQVCVFHVVKEINKAVLHALAGVRKRLAARIPKLPRGRPRKTPEARRVVRRAKRIETRVAELFENRHLFVRHQLSVSRREKLKGLMRGERTLKALRAIVDEVYRLFDRRCRMETALTKLDRLRCRVKRFRSLGRSLDKLKSPTLEKALEFLDDKLMPATSNAVERGNRRHRKMQKSVYRVRTKANLAGRMALDLQRERQASGRESTSKGLHGDRAQVK
jgi:transposase-like protein